jgi:hypothetical protein
MINISWTRQELKDWKAAEEQRRNAKARRQRGCKHRACGDNDWAIGLQHNFPDMQPRGICYLCNFVIQPRHWVDWIPGHPGAMTVVTASMLYPVVTAIERRDSALDFLGRIYIATVDSLMRFDETALIVWAGWVSSQARKAVRQQCEDDTAIYRS